MILSCFKIENVIYEHNSSISSDVIIGKKYIEDYDIVYQNTIGYVFKKRTTE